jgi:hypothetical protein
MFGLRSIHVMENVYDYDRAVKQQAFFDLTMIVQ